MSLLFFIRITQTHNYEPLPNMPVSLLLLIIIVILTYVPGSPTMYGHMVTTRKKQLALRKEKDAGQKKE